MFEVANRRVIITGAAQGLGKEFVRRLLQVINFLIFFLQKISFRKSYFISYADKHKTFLSTKVDRWQQNSKVERPDGLLLAFRRNEMEISSFCKYLKK